MRTLFTTFLILLLAAAPLFAMTDAAALAKAQTLWGSAAQIAKVKRVGMGSAWVYQVGCYLQQQGQAAPSFIIAGQGKTWDKAFAAVNLARNGSHVLSATARYPNGNTATSTPVQIFLCNP